MDSPSRIMSISTTPAKFCITEKASTSAAAAISIPNSPTDSDCGYSSGAPSSPPAISNLEHHHDLLKQGASNPISIPLPPTPPFSSPLDILDDMAESRSGTVSAPVDSGVHLPMLALHAKAPVSPVICTNDNGAVTAPPLCLSASSSSSSLPSKATTAAATTTAASLPIDEGSKARPNHICHNTAPGPVPCPVPLIPIAISRSNPSGSPKARCANLSLSSLGEGSLLEPTNPEPFSSSLTPTAASSTLSSLSFALSSQARHLPTMTVLRETTAPIPIPNRPNTHLNASFASSSLTSCSSSSSLLLSDDHLDLSLTSTSTFNPLHMDPSRPRYTLTIDPVTSQPRTITTDMSTIYFATTPCNTNVVLKYIHDPVLAKQEVEFMKLLETNNVPHTLRVIEVIEMEDVDLAVEGWMMPAVVGDVAMGESRPILVMPALEKFSTKNLDLCDIALVARQLFKALQGLHRLNIAHLDVTPANLMRDPSISSPSHNLVLIDYGLSRRCTSTPHPQGRGTCGYIAPEILDGTGSCTQADMYSAGIILGQLLEPYLPGMSLQYLGSRLVRPTTTTFASKRLRACVERRDALCGYRPPCVTPPALPTFAASAPTFGFFHRPPPQRVPSLTHCEDAVVVTDEECEVVKDLAVRHAADLLARLLEGDIGKRITAWDALWRHPFLGLVQKDGGVKGASGEWPALREGDLRGSVFCEEVGDFRGKKKRREMVGVKTDAFKVICEVNLTDHNILIELSTTFLFILLDRSRRATRAGSNPNPTSDGGQSYANIWKHRLPPGLVHNILPQDRCDAAIYHSDLLVTPDIQLESEFKIIQSVPEMPKHLPDPHRPGSARRRRILAIFNGQEDYGPFCNVRMDALYLANRTGVLVMFIEPKKPNFDQKVEEMVFHDFLNNEKITLSPSLPQGTVRSIPGTNLVVIVSDQDHIGLYIWDENHKDFNMVGDTTDVFRNAVGIFTGTPRAITSSWGVVLTGFGGEDSPTFLQYRLNHDGSGLTFSNGCHWRDEGIESYGPRDISNSDQDICWTTLLGTSVLTYENDDGNEHFFAANIFETNTNETGWMHWEGIETDDVAMPCGDRVHPL
ncbi:hypothetical protein BC829DRAFT_451614 [Chytridium lagenaria]|nr:hypothetical protein BC829DRAFT_451614 [Chytridium lagenaria]